MSSEIYSSSQVMGHRGVPSLAPENTLGGFRKAAELGVPAIEMDVTLLGDGTPVVSHDDTLTRCAHQDVALNKLAVSDLARFDVSANFANWPFEQLPTLAEALECLKSLNLGLNLELKKHKNDAEALVSQVADVLDHAFPAEKLMVSSFDEEILGVCKAQLPEIRRAWIVDELPLHWQDIAVPLDLFSVNCHWRKLTYRQAREIKERQLKFYCWTANDIELIHSFWHWGMDCVITDTPQKFLHEHETER